MRILLVIAPWSYASVHPGKMGKRGLLNRLFGTVGGASEPLGLLYIGAMLKRHGHQVRLLDGGLEDADEKEILRTAGEFSPQVVGLSSMKHNWPATMALARKLRRALPSATLVLGGPQVGCWREETLEECPDFDLAVAGEGEHAMVEICEALERGTLPAEMTEILGLLRREGERVVANEPRPPLRDLAQLPWPDYSLVDFDRYRPSVGFYNRLPSMNLITSRGCPHRCTFCVSNGRIQLRSVEDVVREMTHMVRAHGVRHVAFYDEGITLSRRRATALCEAILDEGLDVSWCANARVDEVDAKLLGLMKRAGCWKLLYGLESGVQGSLDSVGKGTTVEQARQAIRLTREAGIETFGTFLFGIPGETFEDGLRTIDEACSLGLDYAAFLNLVAYKGSEIYNNIDRYGTLTGKWSTNLISFVPHSITLEQLKQLNTLAARRFYRNPSYLLRRLLAIRSVEDVKRNLRGFLAYTNLSGTDC